MAYLDSSHKPVQAVNDDEVARVLTAAVSPASGWSDDRSGP
jgi:hypothetical protein